MKVKPKKINKILFVGTGGGNDIFSTLLAMLTLKNQGWTWNQCSIAGVLSPFHYHKAPFAYIPQLKIKDIQPESTRYIVTRKEKTPIKFVDAAVAKLVAENPDLGISKVFGLPISGGTKGLTEIFKFLGRAFDYIVLVDVGGDIFYQGKTDTHVLSPMFDAMVLRAFVDSKVPGILFEAGPGTDGELDPESLEQVLEKTNATAYPLQESVVRTWAHLYHQWIAGTREGKTVPVTISAFESSEKELVLAYRARAQRGTERIYHYFDQRIKTSLCKHFFLVDPSRISNPFAVSCTDPIDWMKKTQSAQHRTNCEANVQTFCKDNVFTHILTPSPLFPETDRGIMINQGLQSFATGAYDKVIIFPDDWNKVSETWKDKIKVIARNGFITLKLR